MFVLSPARAQADIGIVIADPTGIGSSAYTHAGHSLVYLSGVCAESPVRARLCNPGEPGSVVSNFPDYHELKPYQWNIVPLSLYVNGTTTQGNRLLYGSRAVKTALAERARSGYFWEVCAGTCPLVVQDYWSDLVAATVERDIFIYAVKTTREQDEVAVRWLNTQDNVNRYNPIFNNCARFVQSLVNTIFSHSVHRDILNDIAIMSPKAAARSFSQWAHKRPELGFYSMHFEQKPGSIRRSGTASNGTEAALHIKKYLVPAVLFGDHEVAGSLFVTYLLTGRFSLYKEYLRYATPELIGLEAKRQEAKKGGDLQRAQAIEHELSIKRAAVNGTDEEWSSYRQRFIEMTRAADIDASEQRMQVQKCFDSIRVSVDEFDGVWLRCEDNRRVGVNSTNVLAKDSDPALAFDLLMLRIGYILEAKRRMRPSMQEFRQDWALFEQAYERLPSIETAGGWKIGMTQGNTVKNH
jgi:hypothetical protein